MLAIDYYRFRFNVMSKYESQNLHIVLYDQQACELGAIHALPGLCVFRQGDVILHSLCAWFLDQINGALLYSDLPNGFLKVSCV